MTRNENKIRVIDLTLQLITKDQKLKMRNFKMMHINLVGSYRRAIQMMTTQVITKTKAVVVACKTSL